MKKIGANLYNTYLVLKESLKHISGLKQTIEGNLHRFDLEKVISLIPPHEINVLLKLIEAEIINQKNYKLLYIKQKADIVLIDVVDAKIKDLEELLYLLNTNK